MARALVWEITFNQKDLSMIKRVVFMLIAAAFSTPAGAQQKMEKVVASWLPNGKDALVAWFGAAAAGLTYATLNTAYRGALLEDTLNLLQARVLIAHAGLVDRLDGLELPLLERIVVVGELEDIEGGGLRPMERWGEVSTASAHHDSRSASSGNCLRPSPMMRRASCRRRRSMK